jgi:hypothetical protein
MLADGRNHEAATNSCCDVAGRVSLVTRGQRLQFCWSTPRSCINSAVSVARIQAVNNIGDLQDLRGHDQTTLPRVEAG